jgi:hypothetical protein
MLHQEQVEGFFGSAKRRSDAHRSGNHQRQPGRDLEVHGATASPFRGSHRPAEQADQRQERHQVKRRRKRSQRTIGEQIERGPERHPQPDPAQQCTMQRIELAGFDQVGREQRSGDEPATQGNGRDDGQGIDAKHEEAVHQARSDHCLHDHERCCQRVPQQEPLT